MQSGDGRGCKFRQLKWASGNDRLFAGTRFVTVFGELDVPPPSELQRALAIIGDAGVQTRVKLMPSMSTHLWRTDGQPIVRPLPDAVAAKSMAEMLEYVRRSAHARRPLELHASDRFLVLDTDHGLGDGRFPLELMSALLALCQGVRSPWIDQRAGSLGLPRAVATTFGRHPTKALGALRQAASSRHSRGKTPQTVDVAHEGCGSWSPSFAVSVAHISADVEAAVEHWRRSGPSTIGSAAVWAYVVRRALHQAGLETQDRMMFAFDSRRYIAPKRIVNGNFAVGLSLSFSDQETPQGLDQRLRETIKSAVPLAGQAAIAARSMVGSRRASPVRSVRLDEAAADVMYSDVGTITVLDDANWCRDDLRTVTALIDPAGPQSMTALNTRVGTTRNITISYHDNVFGRAVVDRAARYVSDPRQLLGNGVF